MNYKLTDKEFEALRLLVACCKDDSYLSDQVETLQKYINKIIN